MTKVQSIILYLTFCRSISRVDSYICIRIFAIKQHYLNYAVTCITISQGFSPYSYLPLLEHRDLQVINWETLSYKSYLMLVDNSKVHHRLQITVQKHISNKPVQKHRLPFQLISIKHISNHNIPINSHLKLIHSHNPTYCLLCQYKTGLLSSK